MSSQIQPSGTFNDPISYKIVSPTVAIDASGGQVLVSGNSKFNTNIPLDRAMAITQVDWIVVCDDLNTLPNATQAQIMEVIGQLTEALSRTTPALTDPVDVDIYLDELITANRQDTAVGDESFAFNRQKALERHVLRHPWLSVAQQLNLVCSVGPGENTVQNLGEFSFTCRIHFQLLTLDQALRSFLATRLQISGQA